MIFCLYTWVCFTSYKGDTNHCTTYGSLNCNNFAASIVLQKKGRHFIGNKDNFVPLCAPLESLTSLYIFFIFFTTAGLVSEIQI